MKIKKVGSKLQVFDCAIFGDVFKKLIGCPDRREFKNGLFTCIDSMSNVEHLLNSFPNAQWVEEAEVAKFQYYAQKKQEEEMLKNKAETPTGSYPEVFKTKPFDHQLKAFELCKDAKSYGLFFEQGCGKTKVTIDNAVYLFQKNEIDALVIVAPNGVHSNWINDELPTHCNIEYSAFCWKGKSTKTEMAKLEAVKNSQELKVFSFNIECFVSEKQQKLLLTLLTDFRCLLVIDESQGIKNSKALRTKFFVDINKKLKNKNLPYKRILSGTPVTKGVEDLFSQFLFLGEHILGLTNYYAFTSRYCKMQRFQLNQKKSDQENRKTIQYSKIVGYQRTDELQEKIKTYTFRVLKKDCLDLPEKLYQREFITMTPDQVRIDEEIRLEGITYVKNCKERGEPITIANVLARMVKRQQVACGYLLNVEEQKVVEIVTPDKNPRLIRLRELMDRIEGKVIIWARFTQDINYIMNMLGNQAVRYDGLVDGDLREINKKLFQKDDATRYFVGKPIKGLTLTAATTAIFYSNDFDLEKRQQAEDRNHRFGTKEVADELGVKNILYIDIQAQNSIDNRIITALRAKKKISDMILQDPENLFME